MNNRRKLIVVLGASALVGVVLLGYLIWSGYQDAIHSAETTTRNYAAIIEARLDATLRRADADLQELARTIPVAALSQQAVPRYARELDAELDSRLTNFPELAALRVFDANGDRLYTSGNDITPRTHISDRSYFRLLRDNPQAGLVFSEVLISRSRNQPSMVAARALRDKQGTFHGVVFAAIELDHFQKLFQSLDLGAQGTISLRRTDDQRLVLRWPHLADAVNKPLDPKNPTVLQLAAGDRTATKHITAETDGITRIFSSHALERYPFYVNVAFGRDDVLAAWRLRSLAVGLCGLLLVGLLTGLLYRLWRTEARQAQAMSDLAQSEERFRAIFDYAGVGIAMRPARDRHHPWVQVNDQFCKLLGYTREELLGLSTADITPPDEQDSAVADNERLLRGEIENYSREKQIIRKDGSRIWVNLAAAALSDADGHPRDLIAVYQDITERKRSEEARANLAAIVENANDAIFSRTLDGTITSWNAGAERIFGYTAAEAVGRPATFNLAPGHQPNLARNTAQVLRGEVIKPHPAKRMTKDGRLVDVLTSHSPIRDSAGSIVGASVIIHDITALRQAEETRAQLAAIVENANDAIIGRTLDGTITSWNAAAERIFGYSASEAIGQSSSILTPEPLRRQTENNERLRRGIPVPAQERKRITKDGRIISVISSISPVRNEAGEVVSAAIITHDISELKQAQHELEQLNRELEQRVTERTADLAAANLELETFSYSVAHDLRAPLRAINGYSAIVLEASEGKLDQAAIDNIKRVRTASERMGDVIDDLLNLTQLSRHEMQWRDFNLSELAATVVASLTDAHPERDVLVTIQPDMNINGDPGLMRVVLENLIGNAWKFTAKTGAARIEIGTGQRDGQTVYYVRDNGAGFDMKYVHKLFAPFQRLHRSDEFEGTGIGLATVKKIIQRHGGKIWIESAIDAGTTVFFTIGKSA